MTHKNVKFKLAKTMIPQIIVSGCAKGTGTVYKYVYWNLQLVFREQTLTHVQKTEATLGIARFVL